MTKSAVEDGRPIILISLKVYIPFSLIALFTPMIETSKFAVSIIASLWLSEFTSYPLLSNNPTFKFSGNFYPLDIFCSQSKFSFMILNSTGYDA